MLDALSELHQQGKVCVMWSQYLMRFVTLGQGFAGSGIFHCHCCTFLLHFSALQDSVVVVLTVL